MFRIYVNDVYDIIVGNTACKLLADGIKLYSYVETDGASGDLAASLNKLIFFGPIDGNFLKSI